MAMDRYIYTNRFVFDRKRVEKNRGDLKYTFSIFIYNLLD